MKGSCLCGGVQYEVNGPAVNFAFDPCSRCRKASGSAFMAELICKTADFRWIAGESLVRKYECAVREMPPGYSRVFCSVCGCNVPDVHAERVYIPAGSLDDDPGMRPEAHIFAGYKAPWFEIADKLPQFRRHPPPEAVH
jgi:hypothetical protein